MNEKFQIDDDQISGVELSKAEKKRLKRQEKKLKKIMDIFIVYPDIYLDIIKPSDSSFELFFYQRIILRALMRYKDIYVTAPRAFSKSFIVILGMFL